MRILLVDNFDSFTSNIAQYVYEVCGSTPEIIPNNTPFEQINLNLYDAVILSPGPGSVENEEDFGICKLILAEHTLPILGVCLGHQGINHFYGGKIQHAPKPVHGYRSKIRHSGQGIFRGLVDEFEVVRYHSLLCTTIPECLEVTAWTEDGLVMGLAHNEYPIYGVQFHPESIDSDYGHELLANFLRIAIEKSRQSPIKQTLISLLDKVGGPIKISMSAKLLPDNSRPEDIFNTQLSAYENSFWLDSELCQRPESRYSVMGRGDPCASLIFSYEVTTRELTIVGPSGSAKLTGDFFELMDQLFITITQEASEYLPFPFQSGVVGYLGYELKALKVAKNRHLSNYPDALLYLPQNYFVFDHQEQKSWVCNTWGPTIHVENNNHNIPHDIPISSFKPGPMPVSKVNLEDSPQEYIEKIKQCLDEIRDGESYEICLTNRARIQFDRNPLEAYHRMRHISPVPYGAYLKNKDFAVLSASPEKFLTIENSGRVRSKPIKGTRPRGITPQQDQALKRDLEQSRKDRAENLMIVDLVRHDLNSICVPGSVEVPLAFGIESYSSVHQLVSTIEGKLPITTGVFQSIKACFPGGSMTGAPKIRTMEIIDRLENSSRGIYSGAIGWIGLNRYADLSIVIRTAVIRDGIAEFGIGGAIIADSDPQEEMEETLVKASVPFHSLNANEKVKSNDE